MNSSIPPSTAETLFLHWKQLQSTGQSVSAADLCREHPQLLAELLQRIEHEPQAGTHKSAGTKPVESGAFTPESKPNDRPIPAAEPTVTHSPNVEIDSKGLQTITHTGATARTPAGALPKISGYEVLEYLGGGGMGVVYKVKKIGFNITFALKVIRQDRTRSQTIDRFRREAEAMTRLDHPHIVRIYDAGICEDESPYLAMRLLTGNTLAHRLAEFQGDLPKIVELMRKISSAVAYLHDRGFLHRDIKPGNILFDEKDNPFLGDFGLIKRSFDPNAPEFSNEEPASAPATTDQNALTVTGSVIGTPEYMSPEQLEGNAATVGPHSDVFSLGVMFYELVVGNRPSIGLSLTAVRKSGHRESTPSLADQLVCEPALQQIIRKCLAVNREDRFASAIELAAALQNWMPAERATQPRRHHRWRVATLAALLIAAIGGSFNFFRPRDEKKPEPVEVDLAKLQPGIWQPMLMREPVLIRWPNEGDRSRREYQPKTGEFLLSNEKTGLLSFGETWADRYRIKLDFLQTPLVGNVGVFFGFQKPPPGSDLGECYQVIWLITEVLENKGRTLRAFWTAHEDDDPKHHMKITETISRSEAFPPSQGEHHLELVIGPEGLETVLWDEKALSGLKRPFLKGRRPMYSRGQFGLYVSNGNCAVRKLSYQIQGD
jgi:serine/threonine protein kinase